MSKILSEKEAAVILSLSPNTLRQYRSNQTGPHFETTNDGKFLGYTEENLIQYEKQKEINKLAKKGEDIVTQIQKCLTDKLKYTIYKDSFADQIIVNNQRLDDNLFHYIKGEIFKSGIKCTDGDIVTAIGNYTYMRNQHPVLKLLKGLKWDGEDRLTRWLLPYVEDTEKAIAAEMGQLMLIAAIRRIKEPGCKYDLMPIFESREGYNKSTFLRMLALNDKWFSENCDIARPSKEIIEQCTGKWIIEIAELAGFARSTAEHLKAQVSKQDDEARLAYGRMTTQRKRQFIFIGTTNADRYLIDQGDNRRFVPIKMAKPFDIKLLETMIPQLWAEAYAKEPKLYQKGLWLPTKPVDLQELNRGRTKLRLKKDFWDDMIRKDLPDLQRGDYISQLAICKILNIEPSNQPPYTSERIDQCMNRLGYKTIQNPISGLTCYTTKDTIDLENDVYEPRDY